MMKAVQILLVVVLAITVSALPADDTVPEVINASPVEDFLQEASEMVQQKGKNACEDLANATEKEVKTSVESEQAVLNKINTGSGCPNEGQAAVAAAKKAQASSESKKKAADDALAAAKSATINFGDFVFSSLDKNNCNTFFQSNVYTTAEAKVTAATLAQAKAAGEVTEAKKSVQIAISEAAKAVKKCQCKTYTFHEKALSDANIKVAAANKDAWTKAAHLKCVLAGKSTNNCNVPAMPKVAAVPLASGVTKSKCSPIWKNAQNPNNKQCTDASFTGNYEQDDVLGTVKSTTNSDGWYHGCYGEQVEKEDLPVTIEGEYQTNGGNGNNAYLMWGFNYLANDGSKPHYDCNLDFGFACTGQSYMRPMETGCRSGTHYATCKANCPQCGSNSKVKITMHKDGTVDYFMAYNGGAMKKCCTADRKATTFPMVIDTSNYGYIGQIKNLRLVSGSGN